MDIVVIGAGVIGVTTAWYLQQKGHSVQVFDAREGPGLETSYANGGQISVSHAEPWASPGTPMKALKWMFEEDAPLLFRPHMDKNQWRWAFEFLRHCRHSAWEKNTKALVTLGLYSREALQQLRQELALTYDEATRGILHIYTDEESFDLAATHASDMEKFGVDRKVLTASEALHQEPALKYRFATLAGATYTQSDETGDAYLFTQKLAAKAQAAGVVFHYNTRVLSIVPGQPEHGPRVSHLLVQRPDKRQEPIPVSKLVVCTGPQTPHLMPFWKEAARIYPAKGYSATFAVDPSRLANLRMSVTDESRKVVFTPLGDHRLRVAGTAEFNGYDTGLNIVRCQALTEATKLWFGKGAPQGWIDWDSVEYWTGLRPSTPNNIPLIGICRPYTNLFINAGHGTLGWTHACGSAKALAAIVSREHELLQEVRRFPWLLP